jgi:hypothetical protein
VQGTNNLPESVRENRRWVLTFRDAKHQFTDDLINRSARSESIDRPAVNFRLHQWVKKVEIDPKPYKNGQKLLKIK